MMKRRRWWIAGGVVAVALVATLAWAANVSNYMEQGGARWVIGGSLDVASGGDLDIESGASLKLNGTAITATADEINALDNTASSAELAYLDGVTTGTSADGKAVVLGSGRTIDVINATALQVGGTTVTATAAELNILDGVTATYSELNNVDGSFYGTSEVYNGKTSRTVTVSGLLPTSIVIGEILELPTSTTVFKRACVPTTGSFNFVLSGDPQTTVTVGYWGRK